MKISPSVIRQFDKAFHVFSHRMKFAREYFEAEFHTQFNHTHGVECLKNVKKNTEDTKQAKKIVYAWRLFADALDRTNYEAPYFVLERKPCIWTAYVKKRGRPNKMRQKNICEKKCTARNGR